MRARIAPTPLLPLLALLTSTVMLGCGGDAAKPVGSLGAACYADHRCNSQLTCVAMVCIKPGPGTPPPSDGAAGANGGAGTDGAAGAGGAGGRDGAADADARLDGPTDAPAATDGGADGASATDTAPDGTSDGGDV